MFSVDENTRIQRMPGGGVEIELDLCCGITQPIHLSADAWCSMVTAVAAEPDTSETHEKVKAIHGVE